MLSPNLGLSRRALLQSAGLGLSSLLAHECLPKQSTAASQLAATSTHRMPDDGRPHSLIGYTQYRTNLPGGRHANVSTMRACVVKADGTEWRALAEELTDEPDSWTQFAGWSPGGRLAMVGRGQNTPEN